MLLVAVPAKAEGLVVREGSAVNARYGPGTSFGVITQLDPGTAVEELERQSEWSRIRLNDGSEAWVNNRFVEADTGDANPTENASQAVGIFAQIGETSEVTSVAFSPNGRLVATGSWRGTAKLWDAASGRLLRNFVGHLHGVTSVAFSPDNTKLLTGSSDRTARLWDLASGKHLQSFKGHSGGVSSVVFSPDGTKVLTGTEDQSGTGVLTEPDAKGVRLFDVASGVELRSFEGHSKDVHGVAFSPNGTQVLTGSEDKIVRLWDVASGRQLRSFEGHSERVSSVAFSPDGAQVLTGSWDDTATLWDSASGKVLRSFQAHTGDVASVAFSPDGTQVLTGSRDKTAKLWDVASGRELRSFEGHSSQVTSVAFSPDGASVLTGFFGRKTVLWDASTGSDLLTLEGHTTVADSLAVSPDSTVFLTGSGLIASNAGQEEITENTVRLWDGVNGRKLRNLEGSLGPVESVAFSPDGIMALAGNHFGSAFVWDVITGKQMRDFDGRYIGPINGTTFSPDSTKALFATGNHETTPYDKKATLWDIATGALLQRFAENSGHKSQVNAVAYSPNGASILTGSDDETAKLWDAVNGKELRSFKGHSAPVVGVAFSPDGTNVLTGSWDRTAKQWDVASGKQLRSFEGHLNFVSSVAFSPDGGQVLTGSEDMTARLWDVASGKQLRSFEGHSGGVNSVAFGAGGQTVFTASSDGTTRMWRTSDGKELASFIAFTDSEWVVITPEGFFNASPGGAKYLNVVKGLDVISIDQVYDALYRPDLVKEALAGDPDGKVKAAAEALDLEKVIASGLPPAVKMVSPVVVELGGAAPDASKASGEVVEVEVELTARGGGIGRVEWRVNGTTQGDLSDRGFERVSGDASTGAGGNAAGSNGNGGSGSPAPVRVKQKLLLSAGRNEITVLAYNAANLIASDPIAFTLDLDATAIADPKLYVLAVGVDDYYDSRLKLNYAVSDATSLGEAMKLAGKGLYSEVVVKTVLDTAVTRDGLDAAFGELAGVVRPGDVFVFFLAGHGKTQDGRYYFIPRDFRYEGEASIKTAGIGQEAWQEWFATIAAQKSILLYDTCESGSLTGDQSSRSLEGVAALDRLTRATGRMTLTAATDTAPALEGYRGHGLFTYAVLDALENGDGDNNKSIDVTELANFVDRALPELSQSAFGYRQVPQMNIRGNSFPLAVPTRVLASNPAKPAIPKTPTHVVIAPADLFTAPGGTKASTEPLKPGTQVRILELKNGWALVARDGEQLGYVAEAGLAGLQ